MRKDTMINTTISTMENVVAEGQPFAKRNKERRIRAGLLNMRIVQERPPMFEDVWACFKGWIFHRWFALVGRG